MNDQYVTRQGKILFFRKGILSGSAVAEAIDDCDAVGIQVCVNELYDALAALEEENERLKARVAELVEVLTELCDEIDKHEIHTAISNTSISWFKRKARTALDAYRKEPTND